MSESAVSAASVSVEDVRHVHRYVHCNLKVHLENGNERVYVKVAAKDAEGRTVREVILLGTPGCEDSTLKFPLMLMEETFGDISRWEVVRIFTYH